MHTDSPFISGLDLSRELASEILPALRESFPDMPITLALIGPGSDVLGYDTLRSRDHDWGPRVSLLVPDDRVSEVTVAIDADLDRYLPATILGYPTRFSLHPDGTGLMDGNGTGHRVRVTSLDQVIRSSLLIDSLDELDDAVWLSTPMQTLLEITRGEVFIDDSGELTELRSALAFYPDHIWRYQLAGLWMRVGQIQPFIGRCIETGDVPGAAAIALGIVRDFMRIGLLQSRQYAPYSKWLGTAFQITGIGQQVGPALNRLIHAASDFPVVEHELNSVGCALIEQLNHLGLLQSIEAQAAPFWSRPYLVLPAEDIAHRLRATLNGTGLEKFEATLGGIDVISDSTDAVVSDEFRLAVRALFA